MSTANPFGSAPAEETFDMPVPSAEDDPFGPIGTYDENNNLVEGVAKLDVPGKCVSWATHNATTVKAEFVCTEGKFAGRTFPTYVSFKPQARFKVVEVYKALGLPLDRPFPKAQPIGCFVILGLQDEEYEGRMSAKIGKVKVHPKGAGFRGTSNLPA